MVGPTTFANDLPELPDAALVSLGVVLAKAQRTLQSVLRPSRVYVGRFGHSSGYPVHFHIIPIYEWVEKQFWKDSRYRVLETFSESSNDKATDGAELTFFVWREFCERPDPPPIHGPSVMQVIVVLRESMR